MRYPAHEAAEKNRRILDAAARLFRERGFLDVGVSEIMKASGLTHGPFYNHFASKQDLLAKAVAHASADALADLLSRPRSVEAREAYVRGYLTAEHCRSPGSGCLMASLASDAARDPSVKPAFTAHLRRLIDRLSDHFPWRRDRKARSEAIHTLAAMVGGLVLARACDDAELADEILVEVARRIAEDQRDD